MKVLSRKGSICIIQRDNGEVWETRRKKLRHDCRRRTNSKYALRVIHIPIRRIPQKGDWLFTCSMQPQQFNEWRKQDPNGYDKTKFTKEGWEQFLNWEYFRTLNGSIHSKSACSLKLISTPYAEWFIKHKVWELFDLYYNDWEQYEQAVKDLCKIYKIQYEGI